MRLTADVIEDLPEGVAVFPTFDGAYFGISQYDTPPDERKTLLAEVARVILAHTGRKVEKTYEDDGAIRLDVPLAYDFKICVRASGVCKAVVVGKKTVTKKELVTEAVYKEVEVEIDDVEWDCSASVLSDL